MHIYKEEKVNCIQIEVSKDLDKEEIKLSALQKLLSNKIGDMLPPL